MKKGTTTKTKANTRKITVRRIVRNTLEFNLVPLWMWPVYANIGVPVWNSLPQRIRRIPTKRSKAWFPPKKCSPGQGTPVYIWRNARYVRVSCSRKGQGFKCYCRSDWDRIMGEEWKSATLPGSPKKFWWK